MRVTFDNQEETINAESLTPQSHNVYIENEDGDSYILLVIETQQGELSFTWFCSRNMTSYGLFDTFGDALSYARTKLEDDEEMYHAFDAEDGNSEEEVKMCNRILSLGLEA